MSNDLSADSATISIIIPVYNEEKAILEQLQYLSGCSRDFPTEIIVVDGGSTDSTVLKVRGEGFTCLSSSGKGRAIQMNAGARFASGEILYFVHADSKPPKTFQKDIRNCIRRGHESGCYRFAFDSDHPLLKLNSYFTRFNRLMCRGGDQTLFITRPFFDALGGFREDYKIMEDFEFIRRVQNSGSFTIIPKDAVVSSRKYSDNSYLKVNVVNLIVFTMFFLGASQRTMVHAYKNLIVNTKFG
jgi:rSAM/selenodomain-associated transferase 2